MRFIALACVVILGLGQAACITVRDTAREETSRTLTDSARGAVRPAAPPDLDVRLKKVDAKQVTLAVEGTQRCSVARRDEITVEGTVERELVGWLPHLWVAGGFALAGGALALGATFAELRIVREAGWASGAALAGFGVLEALYVAGMVPFAADGTWRRTEVEARSDEEPCDPLARGLSIHLELSPAHTSQGHVAPDGTVKLALPAPEAIVPSPPDAVVLEPALLTGYAVPPDGAAAQFSVPPPLAEAAPITALYARAAELAEARTDEILAAWSKGKGERLTRLRSSAARAGELLLAAREARAAIERAPAAASAARRAGVVEQYGAVLEELARYTALLLDGELPPLARLPGVDPRLGSLEAATTLVDEVTAERDALRARDELARALEAKWQPCGERDAAAHAQRVRAAAGVLLWPGPTEDNTRAFEAAARAAGACRARAAVEALVHARETLRPRLLRERQSCAADEEPAERAAACARATLLSRAVEGLAQPLLEAELPFLLSLWRAPQSSRGVRDLVEEVMTSSAYKPAEGDAVRRYLESLAATSTEEPGDAAD